MGNKVNHVTIENLGRKNFVVLGALAALVVSCLCLAWAGSANAQLPSGCVEYDDPCIGPIDEVDEDGDFGPGFGGGNNPGHFGDGDGLAHGGSGDADGNLPFTGYPLTGLILLLLVLLLAGLAIRSVVAAREKLAARAP